MPANGAMTFSKPIIRHSDPHVFLGGSDLGLGRRGGGDEIVDLLQGHALPCSSVV